MAATTLPSVDPPLPVPMSRGLSGSLENLAHYPSSSAYELGPELEAQRRNVGFPFTPYHSAYTPYAPYRNLYPPVDKRVNGETSPPPMPLDKERQRQLEVKQQRRQLKQQQMLDRQKVPTADEDSSRRKMVRFRGDNNNKCYYTAANCIV